VVIKRAPKPQRDFQILRNDVARDARLSYRATGLLVELLSRPDDWAISADRIAASRNSNEGIKAIRTTLAELERAGYLVRRRVRDRDGRFVWVQEVYDVRREPGSDVSAGRTISPSATDGEPSGGKGTSLEEPRRRTDNEDELECPASGRFAPSGGANTNEDHLEASDNEPDTGSEEFVDWREEDVHLFRSIVGEQLETDGRRWSPVGVHPAWAYYDAFRKDKRKPIDWPGRYVDQLAEHGQLEEWLARRGLTMVS
jgi:hypothetical protein